MLKKIWFQIKKKGEDDVAAQVLEKAINRLFYFSKNQATLLLPSPNVSKDKLFPLFFGWSLQKKKRRKKMRQNSGEFGV
jgi:hypothetical protein